MTDFVTRIVISVDAKCPKCPYGQIERVTLSTSKRKFKKIRYICSHCGTQFEPYFRWLERGSRHFPKVGGTDD